LKSYKEAYKKLKDEFNSYENKSKENEIAFQQKLDNFKELIKGNESLKRDLEKTKSEMKHLKNQVNELEKSELLLKNMLGTNKVSNTLTVDPEGYLQSKRSRQFQQFNQNKRY